MESVTRARRLRRKQTWAEKTLWRLLRDRRFAGYKFRRQHRLGDYFPGFYCAEVVSYPAVLSGSTAGWQITSSLRTLLVLLCGWLAADAPLLAKDKSGADTGLKDAVVLVIRHGEKPNKGDKLSKTGANRAKAYVNYFKNFTVDSRPLKFEDLFAAADSKESHRPRLTLEPLSKALGLAIDARFSETQNQELVAAIRKKPPGRQVLICWHHQQIPHLLSALGANPGSLLRDGKWPDDVFGWVIQLRFDSEGQVKEARRIDEHLMPDDSGK